MIHMAWQSSAFERKELISLYRASHVLEDLGWVDLDLASSPGWWAGTVATYCLSRMVEHPKSRSTKPSPRGHGTPCTCSLPASFPGYLLHAFDTSHDRSFLSHLEKWITAFLNCSFERGPRIWQNYEKPWMLWPFPISGCFHLVTIHPSST